MMELQIILPARQMDELADQLVALTAAIESRDPTLVAHGMLGGAHGYGAHWDSPVFMMHPFCWCESGDCRWCDEDACGCAHEGPQTLVDGRPVTHDEWSKWNRGLLGPMPHDIAKYGSAKYKIAAAEWDARVMERDQRSKTVWPARVHTCEPRGMMADRPEGETHKPSQSAPNFWHKPSGLRVWWYKYIGRDQEVVGPPDADLHSIFADCQRDVASASNPAGLGLSERVRSTSALEAPDDKKTISPRLRVGEAKSEGQCKSEEG